MCGYFAAAFVLLSFENFHKVYASMYYVGHLSLVGAIVLALILMPFTAEKKPKESDGKRVKTD